MPQPSTPVALADRHERVETPEHVALGYALADLGSRFAALCIDALIVFLGLGTLWIGVPFLVLRLGGLAMPVAGWGLGVILIVSFVLVWGYFVYFEGLRDGQTPGKRLLRIRVVHDGGFPLTLRGAAIRNLLRVLDIQPLPSWLVGGAFMMLHPRTKRVGDIAAGTIVVRERTVALTAAAGAAAAGDAGDAAAPAGPPRLGADELAALTRYIERRGELRRDVRERIAGQLAARLAPRLGGGGQGGGVPGGDTHDGNEPGRGPGGNGHAGARHAGARHAGNVVGGDSPVGNELGGGPGGDGHAGDATPRATVPGGATPGQAAPVAGGADEFLLRLHADESARHAAAGGAAGAANAQTAALARRQRQAWAEYRDLLEVARRRGLARLPERRVTRFAQLYREIAADLARVRSYGGSESLTYSLERWVGAGHNLFYRPTQRSWARMRGWLGRDFPALVRRRWRPIVLAAAFLYGPTLVAYAAVRDDPARMHRLLPAEMIARAESAPGREAEGRGYIDMPEVFMPVFASGIIANNVQVTFFAFAGGVMAGLGTLSILVFNGVNLGAVAGAYANYGASLNLWTFVLPHGVIELTAICIAGGAGFWLAAAILMPGRRTRREALVANATEAVSLLGGTVVLLSVAGLIEGFISPAAIPRAPKLAFAGGVAVLLVSYLAVAGRATATRPGRRDEAAG